MSLIQHMRWKRKVEDQAHQAFVLLVDQSRHPLFFTDFQVPDTLDGRFELMSLHMVLLLRRLKDVPASDPLFSHVRQFGQALYDTFFQDIDLSLREMGVGDMGIGRRVKQMVQAFHGRIEAYEIPSTWDQGGEALLKEAVTRNLYGTCAPSPVAVEGMVNYVKHTWSALQDQPIQGIIEGAFWCAPALHDGV